MSTSTLPTPRVLLTSLLHTLTSSPPPRQHPPPVKAPDEAVRNPLKLLPPSQRALLSTMHVLFPPPMLLQALDLLDRGLVLRVREEEAPPARTRALISVPGPGVPSQGEEGEEEAEEEERDVFPPQANVHLRSSPPLLAPAHAEDESARGAGVEEGSGEKGEGSGRGNGNGTVLYQVRSSQPPRSRFRDAGAGTGTGSLGGMVYTVRLAAWNCSCAAFAFSCFPASSSSSSSPPRYPLREVWEGDRADEGVSEDAAGGEDDGDAGWEFGGWSRDGRDGGQVPCCKHLLACVLGERWDVLTGYVKERVVGRAEMAGLGCEA